MHGRTDKSCACAALTSIPVLSLATTTLLWSIVCIPRAIADGDARHRRSADHRVAFNLLVQALDCGVFDIDHLITALLGSPSEA